MVEEDQLQRLGLTAAYLLKYWADKGVIPRYDGVIDRLSKKLDDDKNQHVCNNHATN